MQSGDAGVMCLIFTDKITIQSDEYQHKYSVCLSTSESNVLQFVRSLTIKQTRHRQRRHRSCLQFVILVFVFLSIIALYVSGR